jgi:hypothetical protein
MVREPPLFDGCLSGYEQTTKEWLRSVATIPPAVTVWLVPYVWAVPVVTVMVVPCSWMVFMELLVRGSVGAMPGLVLLRIRKAPPMRRIVLVIELLVKLLMLQMVIRVVKEALILAWIMGKGHCSGPTEDQQLQRPTLVSWSSFRSGWFRRTASIS